MQGRSVARGMAVGIALAVIMYMAGVMPVHHAMLSVVLTGIVIAIAEAIK